MAKSFKDAVLNQRANIIATRKVLAQSRRQGFKYTQNVLEGIFSNLRTTSNSYSAQLASDQARQLDALRRLSSRTQNRMTSIGSRTAASVRNRYGSAIAAGTDLSALSARPKAAAKALKGYSRAGNLLAQGNAAASGTLSSGLKQARAAADYALAQALQYRARNDAQLIAQQKLALGEAKLQYAAQREMAKLAARLEFENYKKKLALEDQGAQAQGQLLALGTAATDAFPLLLDYFRKSNSTVVETADGKTTVTGGLTSEDVAYLQSAGIPLGTAAASAALYMRDMGISPDSPEAQLILSMAQAMYAAGAGKPGSGLGGLGPEGQANRTQLIVDAVSQRLAQLYPQYSKYQKTIEEGLRARAALIDLSTLEAASSGEGASQAPQDTDYLGMGLGAAIGGAVLSPLGPPGIAAGAVLGGIAGTAAENLIEGMSGGTGLSQLSAEDREKLIQKLMKDHNISRAQAEAFLKQAASAL